MSLHSTKTSGLRYNLFLKMVMVLCVAIPLLMLLLSAQFVSAAESGASAPIVLNVDPVLAMTTNTDNLALSVLPTLDGTLSTGEVTVNLSTNNYTGYTLSMSATTDNTALTHTNGTNSINSTSSSVSAPTALSNNTWGWYPSSLATNPGGSNYQFAAIPSLSSAYTIKSTDAMSTNDETTVSFSVLADTSIPAGDYINTITFTAIANYVPKTLTIIFNSNGGTGLMANQYIAAGSSQNLNPSEFSKDGYAFAGWNTSPDGAGTGYADGASYSVSSEPDNLLVILYAQWEELINQLDDVTYMQDLTATQCSNSYDGATATLLDRRDNNSYTIAKINGNCWMTQNLRLAGGTTLTSTYSNVASSYTIPTTDLTTGDNSHTQGEIHNSGNTTNGYWYNFCAASAGTNCQDSTQYDTTYDICPKGWRLPTGSEFNTITGTSYISAFSPITGGLYNLGSLTLTGRGYWWSSTAYNNYYQYRLYYNGSSLDTGNGGKSHGCYVRCIRSS